MTRSLPHLHTARLEVRLAQPTDTAAIVDYYRRNAAFFRPFDPPRPVDFLTEPYWERRIGFSLTEFMSDRSVQCFLFDAANPTRIVGNATLSSIVRGAFQACNLGYALDEGEQGKGLMYEALTALIRYAFDELRLHRLQANHLPDNYRSATLLRRLGFLREGYAENYLYIAGAWRDHVLNALTNPNAPIPG